MADYRSAEAAEYRKLYRRKAWKDRRAVQLTTHPLCAWCEVQGRITSASVADHIEPHRGDVVLFFEGDGETRNRKVRRAVLSIARKNGKTELAAALVLVHLIGPEAELNGEIYSAANDRAQAAIVFNAVRRMVEASPMLQRHLKVVSSTKHIFVKTNGIKAAGSKFVALSAEAGTKHGLNPSFWTCSGKVESSLEVKGELDDEAATVTSRRKARAVAYAWCHGDRASSVLLRR